MNNDLNLIKKAYARFKTSKVAKKVTALALVSAMALSASGCELIFPSQPTTPPIDAANPPITTPPVDTTTPPVDTTTPEPNIKPDIDYSGYSQMLQNVLTNEYYDELIHSVFVDRNLDLLETAAFQPHPYYFLEDQGINTDAIRNEETTAYSMSFVLDDEPNNLYIHTRVLQKNLFYQNYLIRYELTDQEMADYHMLHSGKGQTSFYIQSVFLNEEISRTHTAEIVGSSKMMDDSYEGMKETAKNWEFINAKRCDTIFINPDDESATFTVVVVPNFYDNLHMAFDSEIATLTCQARELNYTNGIYSSPYSFGGAFRVTYQENTPGTFYLPQDTNLNITHCQDFENDMFNPQN